jgi:hypothetical protein
MSIPTAYITVANEILAKVERLEQGFARLDRTILRMDKRIEEIYFEDEDLSTTIEGESNVTQIEEPWETIDEETKTKIKKLGQHIAYNLISDPKDVAAFREFIYDAKKNHRLFTEQELEYIDYADKNFEDIRLSRKHMNIVQGVYTKLYNKPWPFKAVRGYMYKLEGHPMIWEFFR